MALVDDQYSLFDFDDEDTLPSPKKSNNKNVKKASSKGSKLSKVAECLISSVY